VCVYKILRRRTRFSSLRPTKFDQFSRPIEYIYIYRWIARLIDRALCNWYFATWGIAECARSSSSSSQSSCRTVCPGATIIDDLAPPKSTYVCAYIQETSPLPMGTATAKSVCCATVTVAQ